MAWTEWKKFGSSEPTVDYDFSSGFNGSAPQVTKSKTFIATKSGTLIADISVIGSAEAGAIAVSSSCTKNGQNIELNIINNLAYHRSYAVIPYVSGDEIVATGTVGATSNAYRKGVCIVFYDLG